MPDPYWRRFDVTDNSEAVWNFDGTSLSLTDRSENGHDLTQIGSTGNVWYEEPYIDYPGLCFTGEEWFTAANNSSLRILGDLSLEFIILPFGDHIDQTIFGCSDTALSDSTDNFPYMLYWAHGGAVQYVHHYGNHIVKSDILPGTWHYGNIQYCCVTRNSATHLVKYHSNGIVVGTSYDYGAGNDPTDGSNTEFVLGNRKYNSYNLPLYGLLFAVRISREVVDPEEVYGDLRTTYIPPATGSLKERVSTLESTGVSGGALGSVVMEWNGTDLTQFDSKVEGSSVTSSTISVVSYVNTNWIKFEVTSTSGSNFSDTAVWLPFLDLPTSQNYGLVCEFLYGNTGSNGVFLAARNDGSDNMYLVRWFDNNNYAYRLYKVVSDSATQIGNSQHEPTTDADMGSLIGIYVEGETLVRGYCKQQQLVADTSSPITGIGTPLIGLTNNNIARTGIAYVRNIVVFQNRALNV